MARGARRGRRAATAAAGSLTSRARDRRLLLAAAAVTLVLLLGYGAFSSSAQSTADQRTGATAAVTAQAIAQAIGADALLATGVAGADGVADLVRGTASQPAVSAVEYAALNVERANPGVQGLYFYDRRGAYVVGQVANPALRPPDRLGVSCDPTGAFCTDTNVPVGGYLGSPALGATISRLLRTGVAPAPALALDRSDGPFGSLFLLRPIVAPGHSSVVGCLLERVDAAGILRPYVGASSAPSLVLSGNVVIGPDGTSYPDRGRAPVPSSLSGAHPRFNLGGTTMSGSVAPVPGADLRVVSYVPAPALSGPALLLLFAIALVFLLLLAALAAPFLRPLIPRAGSRPARRQAMPVGDAAAPQGAASGAYAPPALPEQRVAGAAQREAASRGGGASAWSVREAITLDAPRTVVEADGSRAPRLPRPFVGAAPAPLTASAESQTGEIDRRILDRPPRQPGLIPALLRRRNRRALPATSPAAQQGGEVAQISAAVGDEAADAALRSLIARFMETFPARVRACYVYGSQADGSSVGGSDVDLAIVFAGSWRNAAEREAAVALLGVCAEQSGIELDGEALAEADLDEGVFPDLKFGSRLVYGTDSREQMALLPIEEWTRNRMHAAYFLIATRFDRHGPIVLPLGYPDPSGPFYGYDSRAIRLPDGTDVPSTRDLIRVAGWAATALVALRVGEYVVRKRDSHLLYRRFIGDEWSDLLDRLYTVCRGEWHYRIPEQRGDRRRLRVMCEAMHSFENHVLGIYRTYLQGELETADGPYAQRLIDFLERVPFDDPAIAEALRALRARIGEA